MKNANADEVRTAWEHFFALDYLAASVARTPRQFSDSRRQRLAAMFCSSARGLDEAALEVRRLIAKPRCAGLSLKRSIFAAPALRRRL